MKKFEHKVVFACSNDIENCLKDYEKYGWELVSNSQINSDYYNFILILKREIAPYDGESTVRDLKIDIEQEFSKRGFSSKIELDLMVSLTMENMKKINFDRLLSILLQMQLEGWEKAPDARETKSISGELMYICRAPKDEWRVIISRKESGSVCIRGIYPLAAGKGMGFIPDESSSGEELEFDGINVSKWKKNAKSNSKLRPSYIDDLNYKIKKQEEILLFSEEKVILSYNNGEPNHEHDLNLEQRDRARFDLYKLYSERINHVRQNKYSDDVQSAYEALDKLELKPMTKEESDRLYKKTEKKLKPYRRKLSSSPNIILD